MLMPLPVAQIRVRLIRVAQQIPPPRWAAALATLRSARESAGRRRLYLFQEFRLAALLVSRQLPHRSLRPTQSPLCLLDPRRAASYTRSAPPPYFQTAATCRRAI